MSYTKEIQAGKKVTVNVSKTGYESAQLVINPMPNEDTTREIRLKRKFKYIIRSISDDFGALNVVAGITINGTKITAVRGPYPYYYLTREYPSGTVLNVSVDINNVNHPNEYTVFTETVTLDQDTYRDVVVTGKTVTVMPTIIYGENSVNAGNILSNPESYLRSGGQNIYGYITKYGYPPNDKVNIYGASLDILDIANIVAPINSILTFRFKKDDTDENCRDAHAIINTVQLGENDVQNCTLKAYRYDFIPVKLNGNNLRPNGSPASYVSSYELTCTSLGIDGDKSTGSFTNIGLAINYEYTIKLTVRHDGIFEEFTINYTPTGTNDSINLTTE